MTTKYINAIVARNTADAGSFMALFKIWCSDDPNLNDITVRVGEIANSDPYGISLVIKVPSDEFITLKNDTMRTQGANSPRKVVSVVVSYEVETLQITGFGHSPLPVVLPATAQMLAAPTAQPIAQKELTRRFTPAPESGEVNQHAQEPTSEDQLEQPAAPQKVVAGVRKR